MTLTESRDPFVMEEVEARCSGGTGKVRSKTPGHSGPNPTRQRGPRAGSNNTHIAEGYSS